MDDRGSSASGRVPAPSCRAAGTEPGEQANPDGIKRGKFIDALAVPGIPAGLPASLLERRPDLLQAEQNELSGAELSAVRARADRYTQRVGVYKTVGGGWIDEADKLASKAQGVVENNK